MKVNILPYVPTTAHELLCKVGVAHKLREKTGADEMSHLSGEAGPIYNH
jgi:hypothetical protein